MASPSVACWSASRCTPSILLEVVTVGCVEEGTVKAVGNLAVRLGQSHAFFLTSYELADDLALGRANGRRRRYQNRRHRHAWLDVPDG